MQPTQFMFPLIDKTKFRSMFFNQNSFKFKGIVLRDNEGVLMILLHSQELPLNRSLLNLSEVFFCPD
jgi:hypothetical protein